MNRRRRPLAVPALVAMAALISACGSSATAGTGGSAGNKAVKFAECMRANGVSEFPDPGPSGTLSLDGVVNGSSLDPSSPAWKRAIGACKDLEPSGFTGRKRGAQQQGVAVKFAACIRQNGVPDFPDPTPNGPLIDTNRIPSTAQPGGMSALRGAMQKCGAIYGGQLGVRR